MSTLEMMDPPQTATSALAERLNWLRAGVLGANDGIVSVAATVVGVAAATNQVTPVLLAGVAAVIAGALSMAVGEYVSVASAADTQRSIIGTLRSTLRREPPVELENLTSAYRDQGLSDQTARLVARELTQHNALSAHLKSRWHLDIDEVLNPWHAAIASAVAFLVGSSLPMLMILLSPIGIRIPATAGAVLLALGITGFVGAKVGGVKPLRPVLRIVIGGTLALFATWAVGTLLGVAVG